jgi:hypothetical protein
MRVWLPALILLPLALAGCPAVLSDWTVGGSGAADASTDTSPGSSISSGGASSGSGGSSGSGDGASSTGGASDAGGSSGGVSGSDGCPSIVSKGEQTPLDIYIMFDTSGSMSSDAGGMSRMDAVRNAVNQFVGDPASGGLGVGIGYFGNMPRGGTSCNPADYATPEVPIAPLPGNAAAITGSLAGKSPTGETPTGAGIRGACTYAKGWVGQNPGRTTVVLLVTDGVPEAPLSAFTTGCSPSLPDAVAAAQECTGQAPQVPIYVLGVGPSLQNLQQIAQNGGSQQAYLVDGTTNVSQAVRVALNSIRGSAQVPCQYQIPPPTVGKQFVIDQVNVQYTPPMSTTPGIIYQAPASGRCDPVRGGWFYDDPMNPKTILLCPSTCTTVTAETGGQLDVALGCETQTISSTGGGTSPGGTVSAGGTTGTGGTTSVACPRLSAGDINCSQTALPPFAYTCSSLFQTGCQRFPDNRVNFICCPKASYP